MRVVLDTNVIVSAFLSPEGKPAAILRMVLHDDLEICVNTAIIVEYEQVLSRLKFAERISLASIRRFFEILYEIGTKVDFIPSINDLPDEADRKFYDTAKTADATLITGNKKHYPDERFIQDPAEFLSRSSFV